MMISNMVFELLVSRTNTYPCRSPIYAPQGHGVLDYRSLEFQYMIYFSFCELRCALCSWKVCNLDMYIIRWFIWVYISVRIQFTQLII